MSIMTDSTGYVTCDCGYTVKEAGLKTHQRGQVHDAWMSVKRAKARGHVHIAHPNKLTSELRLLFPGEFSVSQKHIAGGPGKKTRIETDIQCSRAMHLARPFFMGTYNQRDDSMHAALVFREVYGDECGMTVVAAIVHEVTDGALVYTRRIPRGASDFESSSSSTLHALLRNNGVESPALALMGLASYALQAAVIQSKGGKL